VNGIAKSNSKAFHYPSKLFPDISPASLKEGFFVGTEIRIILEDENFVECLNVTEQETYEILSSTEPKL